MGVVVGGVKAEKSACIATSACVFSRYSKCFPPTNNKVLLGLLKFFLTEVCLWRKMM